MIHLPPKGDTRLELDDTGRFMSIPFIDLDALHAPIRDELDAVIGAVIGSGQFIRGRWVRQFEDEIADYLGCKHAIGVSSGSDALLASLMTLGIGHGDEVITTPFTFCATAEAILRVGATPVFVDIDQRTFNIDPDSIEGAITDATRAVLPVHLFGQCARMDRIMDIAERHNLWVVEDAAQAIGARFRDRMAGTLGHLGCFSFFPTKNLGALGDGGLVTTDDEAIAEELRVVCNHGSRQKYDQVRAGGNFRLDAIQAAALSTKLDYLDGWNELRRDNALRHEKLWAGVGGITTPKILEPAHHSFHQYTLRVGDRSRVTTLLEENDIGYGIYYPKPLHLQPAYSDCCPPRKALSESERACQEVLSLPVANRLSQAQWDHMQASIKQL